VDAGCSEWMPSALVAGLWRLGTGFWVLDAGAGRELRTRNLKHETRTFGWNEVETKLHEQVVGRIVGANNESGSNNRIRLLLHITVIQGRLLHSVRNYSVHFQWLKKEPNPYGKTNNREDETKQKSDQQT